MVHFYKFGYDDVRKQKIVNEYVYVICILLRPRSMGILDADKFGHLRQCDDLKFDALV